MTEKWLEYAYSESILSTDWLIPFSTKSDGGRNPSMTKCMPTATRKYVQMAYAHSPTYCIIYGENDKMDLPEINLEPRISDS